MSNLASAIKAAEAALDRGDYVLCIRIIDPIISTYSATTKTGAQLRLLKVTAKMGKGDEKEAVEICKTLIHNKEGKVRQQAKQLLSILEAPCLPRPSNWSVEIPKLEVEPSQEPSFKKKKKINKKINYPPTGPTKNLDSGFSIITLLIISLIAFFLSGCVDISTNMSITGSDRLRISLDIESISGQSIPWQTEFKDNLADENTVLKIQVKKNKQHFESPTIRFEEGRELIEQIASAASKASGFNIYKPEIITDDRNLIIGTQQNLKVNVDLREFPKIPGLKLNLIIHDLSNKKNFKTKPLEAIFKKDSTLLPLEIGKFNQLEVSYWKWNPITVGIIFIVIFIFINLSLQTFRLKMGFGFPELPP